MQVLGAESVNLFVGSEAEPRQVVRLVLRGTEPAARDATRVSIQGDRLRTEEPVALGPLAPGEEARLEVGVAVDPGVAPGDVLPADVVLEQGGRAERQPFEFFVAEPGWRMFMVSHFHYDPVWWNTQAAYTESWRTAIQYRSPFQEPGLALVKAHLEMTRRDPDYKFVLAELDYLKPYWDVYPEDRTYFRQLLAEGRLELMGGTYNEPNTNLTSAESTIRNAIYGVAYQRDVLGGQPATAWQLDAFGHDPQFPGIMADAGISSSSWARGPFHEWGPHWIRGPGRVPFAEMAAGETPRMQFPMEFDWIAPSGRALLTSFMANHYSAGWWLDASATLDQAEAEAHRLFTELATLATTKNVLLPVGTDYSPPNKWLTAIHRDWNRRYVWPKFIAAIPREFFDAVRQEQATTGRGFSPQTRDMNPIYTGKDVSFIDTKQAQRIAENTLLSAEKFASIAGLLGARFPTEAIDKAWRQLLFGAHHDGITGSESDQVYLDLIGGWREALELGRSTLDGALEHLGSRIDTAGDGQAVTVFNPLSWSRTDIARVTLDLPDGAAGIELRDDAGAALPVLLEAAGRRDDGTTSRISLAFLARDIPALGYRSYRAVPSPTPLDDAAWRAIDATSIENEAYAASVDPGRGGALVSLVEKRTGKELIRRGLAANELLAYHEYPNHPLFAEGPWHLTPDGRFESSADRPVTVTAEESPIGRRIRMDGPFEQSRRTQEIVLWDGVDRVEFATGLHDYTGQDRLFRVRFPIDVEGGAPVSEVGNAVVGRGFGFPNADVAQIPFTLDNPAYNWFALGATARIALVDRETRDATPRAGRAIGIAEVIAPDRPAQDEAVRGLVVALVRSGVTSTLTRADGPRYGVLHIDSNLPDVRVAIGRPADNAFVAAALAAAGPAYAAELDRQLAAGDHARVWLPVSRRTIGGLDPIPDLRDAGELPVLIVAGNDAAATIAAIDELAADLDDAVIEVSQPAELDGPTGTAEDYTVAILNRGIPSFNVEPDGSLYLSLMRSCSGWPSGVWIDPPRRSVPDGSNFQFQHWSHTFEYALTGNAGDWRQGGVVQAGHEYNNPLIVRTFDAHAGELPAAASFLSIEPASAVVTALKPAGNALAHMAGSEVDPADGLVARVYESSGRPTAATIRAHWALDAGTVTNLMEETASPADGADGTITLRLDPYEIATLRVRPLGVAGGSGAWAAIGPRMEPAQPVFADYWMHNKGSAPIGYQPLAVQIVPWAVSGEGPFRLPITVASERTDDAVAGSVALVVPPGWQASPAERVFRLAPGAHLAFEASVSPAPGASPGRYFVAARITDDAGQTHEDVVTIDYRAGSDGHGPGTDVTTRSPSLTRAVQRSLHDAGGPSDASPRSEGAAHDDLGGELIAEHQVSEVRLQAGQRGAIRVSLRNEAASEIRGEAQLLSPHETWPFTSPWTQGFAVGPGEETTVTFDVKPPVGFAGGTYWGLVKIMYFGRLIYTESIPIEITAVEVPVAARAGASR